MMAGHFGLAAAVRAKSPEVPLWSLMLATQLLDIFFIPLYVLGVETLVPVAGDGYGGYLIHAYYTHSLLGALLIALLAGLLAKRYWGRRGGVVIGSVVFSHWLLDLLVHRADMPLLPGNWGDLPLLGFGLWNFPMVSFVMESALIAIGTAMYFRSTLTKSGVRKSTAVTKGLVMGALLVFLLLIDVL